MNKGIGAGGSNTNYYGKIFEEKTNNYKRLLDVGYIECKFKEKSKFNYYLSKILKIKQLYLLYKMG